MPGQVSLDLHAAGIIGEPYKGYNDVLQQWIASDVWTYVGPPFAASEQLRGADVGGGRPALARGEISGRVSFLRPAAQAELEQGGGVRVRGACRRAWQCCGKKKNLREATRGVTKYVGGAEEIRRRARIFQDQTN